MEKLCGCGLCVYVCVLGCFLAARLNTTAISPTMYIKAEGIIYKIHDTLLNFTQDNCLVVC